MRKEIKGKVYDNPTFGTASNGGRYCKFRLITPLDSIHRVELWEEKARQLEKSKTLEFGKNVQVSGEVVNLDKSGKLPQWVLRAERVKILEEMAFDNGRAIERNPKPKDHAPEQNSDPKSIDDVLRRFDPSDPENTSEIPVEDRKLMFNAIRARLNGTISDAEFYTVFPNIDPRRPKSATPAVPAGGQGRACPLCRDQGHVYAREKERPQYFYAFKCSCAQGRRDPRSGPVWSKECESLYTLEV